MEKRIALDILDVFEMTSKDEADMQIGMARHTLDQWVALRERANSKGWHRLNRDYISSEDAWVKILTTSGLSGLQHQVGATPGWCNTKLVQHQVDATPGPG